MPTKSFLSILVIDRLANGVEDVISEVPIDVITSRTPKYTAEISHYPTEAGSSVSDNRRIHPDGFDIVGVVSNTPVNAVRTTTGDSLRGDGEKRSTAKALPAQTAHDALVELHHTGRLVTIVDQYRQYRNMALVSLSFPRDGDTGDAIEFQASFSEVQVVATSAVALPADVLKRLKRKRPKSKSARRANLRAQLFKKVIAGKLSPAAMKSKLAASTKKKAAKTPKRT